MNKMILILPFDAKKGAEGRKEDAINTLKIAHKNIGFDVVTITATPSYCEELLCYLNNFEIKLMKLLSFTNNRFTQYLWFLFILFIIKKTKLRNEIKLVFSYAMTGNSNVLAYLINKFFNIEYVINEHRTIFQRDAIRLPRSQKVSLDNAKVVLSLTPSHTKYIEKYTKTKVFDIPLVLQDKYLTSKVISDDDFSIFKIAAWTNWRDIKRLDLLVEAFDAFSADKNNVNLLIAGPIPDELIEKNIIEYISRHSLQNKVTLLGQQNRDKIFQLANQCHLCILPSDHETFGIPASEALCLGKPVITTRCGGPENFIKDYFNGFTISCDSRTELVDKMNYIYDNYQEFDHYAIAEQARSVFSVTNLSLKLKAIYNNLVGR
ncbi:glycosyltransferase [Shewanella sp. 4_MG-2023]|uniref:glycosyltransferase n=1 Tax=Shewanella sp. 4_MG-2023 TaxID=3062652 RepID=UPI0026E185D2|nr:glycosyltransferase [Shewanella sp. 4_MG-2023]MDO6678461.1 glycosyltransferase [Shewanella sp. 4_MG-2023]